MRAGAGTAPITPTPPVWLAGFGDRTEPAETVYEDLEARALYLSDGEAALCLIVCDLLGMTPDVASPLRDAVAAALGLQRSAVLIACTHTHAGPNCMTGGERLGWHTPEGYHEVLRAGCTAAATAARGASEPATIRYASAALPEALSFNRRGSLYADPMFAVLDVLRPDGDRIATVANFGIHPVALGPVGLEVATDWVGAFRTELEARVGGVAIHLAGALGDINPQPPNRSIEDDTYAPWCSHEETDAIGRALAAAVVDAIALARPSDGRLRVIRDTTIDVQLGTTALTQLGDLTGARTVRLIEWDVGGVRVVAIPGEGFDAHGREIVASRHGPVLLAGLSPEWHGYLPYPWGAGYEEGVSYGEDAVAAINAALLDAP